MKVIGNIISAIKNVFLRFTLLLRKTKIQYRLLVSFALASILPIILVAFFSLMHSTNALTRKISTYSQQLLEQVNQITTSELKVYDNISDTLSNTELVQEGLVNFKDMKDSERFEITREINEEAFVSNFGIFIANVAILKIYTLDDQVFYDLGYDEIRGEDWAKIRTITDENDGYPTWVGFRSRAGNNCIALCKRIIYKHDYSRMLGYIIIAIDEAKFSNKILLDINMGEGSVITVMDTDGTVMSSTNPSLVRGEGFPDNTFISDIKSNEKKQSQVFQTTINDEEYLVTFVYEGFTKWYMTALIPYSYINAEVVNFKNGIFLIGGMCLLFTIVLTLIIYSSITIPLKKMVSITGSIIEGNFDKRINDDASDEVGFLAESFDSAVDKISSLIDKVKAEQTMKRKAEIRMLQAQINPHFLFNTLNSLKWTALMSRAENVSNGIGALSEILRASIIDDKAEITLQEEIKNIENYLVIQRMRNGNMFEVNYDIKDEYYKCRILKFLLQPIVENSIIHGFEGIDYQAVLTISCRKENEALKIKITDNGKGFDTNILEHEGLKERRFSSIGISNIQERIKLSFGEQYGLTIKSNIDKGTTVTVTIPYIIDGEGE